MKDAERGTRLDRAKAAYGLLESGIDGLDAARRAVVEALPFLESDQQGLASTVILQVLAATKELRNMKSGQGGRISALEEG